MLSSVLQTYYFHQAMEFTFYFYNRILKSILPILSI